MNSFQFHVIAGPSPTGMRGGKKWQVGALGDAAKHPHLHKPTPSPVSKFEASFNSPVQLLLVLFSTSDFHGPAKPRLK